MNVTKQPNNGLLPRDALSGVRLGLSVSASPDLGRLGLLETHFKLALAEITRLIVVSGGQLAYGGHLDANGYTAFMSHELERYSRRTAKFSTLIPMASQRSLRLRETKRRCLR
jgi:hypothetical protein